MPARVLTIGSIHSDAALRRRKGADGRVHRVEVNHALRLAALHGELATVVDTVQSVALLS